MKGSLEFMAAKQLKHAVIAVGAEEAVCMHIAACATALFAYQRFKVNTTVHF